MARSDRRQIDPLMIRSVLNMPHRKEREPNRRVRYWGWIAEMNSWLRVVTLEDGETVHNAFFDQDFRP